MWQHNYEPIAGSLGVSAVVAAIPIVVLFLMLGVFRKPAWMSALSALVSALIVALVAYGMPAQLAFISAIYGAAFGIFPIAWIVFASIMLYRLAVDTGKFEIIKDSIGGADRPTAACRRCSSRSRSVPSSRARPDSARRLRCRVRCSLDSASIPFYAAGICLLANTAPVAFGSIGIPVTTLANVTGLPVLPLSAMVGTLCAMVSIIIPGYLIVVMAGVKRAVEVLPAIVACGVSFAAVQFYVSRHMGPELDGYLELAGVHHRDGGGAEVVETRQHHAARRRQAGDRGRIDAHGRRNLHGVVAIPAAGRVRARLGRAWIKPVINSWGDSVLPGVLPTVAGTGPLAERLMVPGLHNLITRIPPVVPAPAPYAALYELNWLSASGTACFFAIIATAIVLRVRPAKVVKTYVDTFKQLKLALVTIACMLGLAYVMNYSGMTSTLGLATGGQRRSCFRSSVPSSAGWACSSPAAIRRRTRCSATCRWSRRTPWVSSRF